MNGQDQLATWADVGFSVYHFSFSFPFLLHPCEVPLKNNYVICANIFFIYNSMDTSFHLGVSRFFRVDLLFSII
jgi:hypothetical protein